MWLKKGILTGDLININRFAGKSGTWLLAGDDLLFIPEHYLLYKSHYLHTPANNKFSSNLGGPRYQTAGSAIKFRDL
jgi:hypothetical protein